MPSPLCAAQTDKIADPAALCFTSHLSLESQKPPCCGFTTHHPWPLCMPLQEDEALLAEALKSSMSKATEDGAGGAVTMIEPPVDAEPLAQLIVRWHASESEPSNCA